MDNVIFVSEVRDPYLYGSSTQIMTFNILYGLKKVCSKVIFIAILERGCSSEAVKEYYKSVMDEFIPIYSILKLEAFSRNKYKRFLKLTKACFTSFLYKEFAEKLMLTKNNVLISHSPSIESVLLCKELKAYNKTLKYIQYWSDPIAISGIYPNEINIKRYPYYILEKYLISIGDDIVYGTKLLFEAQKMIYKSYSKKMRYVDVSYSPIQYKGREISEKPYTYGYTGNYSKEVRNILPLYEAFQKFHDGTLLICGNGNIDLKGTSNIIIQERHPQSEIASIESSLDVFICICNHSCIQIPGKIFYKTNTNKIILVILDGKYSKKIKRYLNEFHRFEFCNNNVESILHALQYIHNTNHNISHENIYKLSPEYIANKILNGK